MSNLANTTELPSNPPIVEALDGDGYPYTRQAFTIGELPEHLRKPALQKAARVLGFETIRYGVPLYESAGMTKADARKDGRAFLEYRGEDLPLDYFWHR
jgi:hypothetical protein